MNSFNASGRLTRDPELRTTASGESVCKMRLAVDRMGRNNETGYIDVTTFGASGQAAAKVLGQGWLVAVSGRLEYGEWETSDGAKRSGHSVIGHVEFLAAPKDKDDTPADPGTDIPF
jgi:single-strand DNA-binding protein